MTDIREAYINALLADATYAVKKIKEGDLDPQKTLVKDLTKRLGASLAHHVVDNFKLDLDSIINTSEIAGTGFDARV
ncbi:hypothetical protein BEL05_02080 [Shewanella colwelliana]|uniref:Uncharacterized protein n=1 Tax=Shewanella colwelliana TaxID=23 RepID=A0A1E5IXQ4_SHECO|nr:hypothetical protein [Shewanella colwelliana]OEG75264.1 hypothetical protein BEL05_02080 [Shewanella colwelliana]